MDPTLPGGSYLGVECGATHSVALFAPGGDLPWRRAEFGPANLRFLDDAALEEHFRTIKSMQGRAVTPVAGIAIGMAGMRNEADRRRINAAAAKVWPGTPCYATDDLETALAADGFGGAAKCATRVLILSGTGSCCYGRKPDGKTVRVGGWGHILGDGGSGYDIGLRGLKESVRFLDREGRLPLLGRNILQALQMNQPEDLIDWAKAAGKSEIAALATQVFAAAVKGDRSARGILTVAAEALAGDGIDCARRMVKRGSPVEFLLAGGVLLKQPGFARQVRARLLQLWPWARATILRREGACGALELARAHFGGCAGTGSVQQMTAPEPDTILPPASSAPVPTEQRNPRSKNLDRMSLSKAVALMIDEESKVGLALIKEKRKIARVIEWVAGALRRDGRLFYAGAGTSGRLGMLDAAECPPTFGIAPDRVQALLAGGQSAVWKSVEGAEDSAAAGASAVRCRGVNRRDVVMGIAASGRTPFVWGALAAARQEGARTVLLCFNPHLTMPPAGGPDLVIAPDVGPEVLTGSTRLKAGTATKVILNMVTTLAMVRLGKVVGNLMVDMNVSNRKLRERAVRIVQAVSGADVMAARAALEKCHWKIKPACRGLR
ncbi:MAG: N-acetylmuramic acid 6-phosphate etherase [Verrucomicrobiota bacterium]|jgi:N-acetylmuramic acid 6-phosphate etherase